MFNLFKKSKDKPNFDEVDSNEKAMELYETGVLSKLYLFPLEFGGKDIKENIIYVPPFVVELKQRFDKMLPDLIEKGLVSNYKAIPEYKGSSFIPAKIRLEATGESSFQEVLNIWE